LRQSKKTPNLERLLICNSKMVRSLDTVWNQFEAKRYAMYEKLARLDLISPHEIHWRVAFFGRRRTDPKPCVDIISPAKKRAK
jgi:hypothetical protein